MFIILGGAIWGAIDVLLYERQGLTLMVDIVGCTAIAMLLVSWCVYDSRLRVFAMSRRYCAYIFLLAVVGVPLYFWRSRSRREFIRSGFGLLLVAAGVFPFSVGWYVTRFVLVASGYYGS